MNTIPDYSEIIGLCDQAGCDDRSVHSYQSRLKQLLEPEHFISSDENYLYKWSGEGLVQQNLKQLQAILHKQQLSLDLLNTMVCFRQREQVDREQAGPVKAPEKGGLTQERKHVIAYEVLKALIRAKMIVYIWPSRFLKLLGVDDCLDVENQGIAVDEMAVFTKTAVQEAYNEIVYRIDLNEAKVSD